MKPPLHLAQPKRLMSLFLSMLRIPCLTAITQILPFCEGWDFFLLDMLGKRTAKGNKNETI
uniref:Uncharacterized protein n=1 Tax=candidate division WOR-3 bacterium TaxID=2052148 RepID=A0A7C6A9M5_UNCW3